MGKSAVLLLVLVFLTTSSVIMPLPIKAVSKTIVVPDDYTKISDAVGNATEGSTIYLKKGIYEIKENSLVINKTLSITGEDQTNTIIIFPPDTRTGYEFFISKIGFQVNANNFQFSNLTITNCDYGIYVTGNGTQVSYTTTSSIYLDGNHCKVSENILTTTTSYPRTLTVKGFFNRIAHNNIFHLQCEGSFNSVIGNLGTSGGIEISGDSNVVAKNCVIEMSLSNSNLNTIYNNSIKTVTLRNCYNNTVAGNIIKGPTIWGILMGSGSGNVFHGNYIGDFNETIWHAASARYKTLGYGVAIGSYESVAEKNLFYHNNFVNNFQDVSANWPILGKGNYWDNGEEGNHWDDYSGVDSNGDGVGDVEYTVIGQIWDSSSDGRVGTVFGRDRYPLTAPFDIANVVVKLPEWASPPSVRLFSPENTTYTSANVTLNFTVNKQTSWMGYSLDGQETVTVAGNTTIAGLSWGLHNITVYVKDFLENTINSDTVCFNIVEPFPITLIAASVVSVAVIGGALLVYFKKRKR